MQPWKEKVKKIQRHDTSSDFFTRQKDKEDWRIQNIHLQSSLRSDCLPPLEHLHTPTAEDTMDQAPEGTVSMIIQFCHGSDMVNEFFYRPLIKALLVGFRELRAIEYSVSGNQHLLFG